MIKAILDAIEALEAYATDKVQAWQEQRQRTDNSDMQYIAATYAWEAYRDMANKLADFGEMAEKTVNAYTKAFKSMEWQYCYDDNQPEGDCYYCPCCLNWISHGHKEDCKLAEMIKEGVEVMSKSILELEMPGSCAECPCAQYYDASYGECRAIPYNINDEFRPELPVDGRRSDCPLKLVEGKDNRNG